MGVEGMESWAKTPVQARRAQHSRHFLWGKWILSGIDLVRAVRAV
jgi:hypothetical protein